MYICNIQRERESYRHMSLTEKNFLRNQSTKPTLKTPQQPMSPIQSYLRIPHP